MTTDRPLPWDGGDVRPSQGARPLSVAGGVLPRGGPGASMRTDISTPNDIATIDPDGTMHITDRAKDVIKSGGEWISSIEIENLAVAHPDVAEAAVIGIPNIAKWSGAAACSIVVPAPRSLAARSGRPSAISSAARSPSWWVPDDVQVVPETAAHGSRQDQQGWLARIVQELSLAGRRRRRQLA